MKDLIGTNYERVKNTPSDINEHLEKIKEIASECESFVEIGVRGVVSTWAILAGKPKYLLSIDIVPCPVDGIKEAALLQGTIFEFKVADSLKIELDPVDGILIDSYHNYDQLKKELLYHGNKAQKYIIFHDTTSFEWYGESYDGTSKIGIWPAIEEFLIDNPHWGIKERYFNNNGLCILQRT